MVKESGKPVFFILNKIDEMTAKKISVKLNKVLIVGIIPINEFIQEKGFTGEEIDDSGVNLKDITDFIIKTESRFYG